MKEFQGKVAVVTGAGRGLGQQMALALAEAGAAVVCAARTESQIEATAEAVRALGRKAIAVPTDVSDSSRCDALIQACLDEFGRIDVMLSNAGVGDARGHGQELWDVTDEDWHETIDVNLSSAFYCARAASKAMIDRGQGGVIVNVASGTALRAYPVGFVYGAAKAGLERFTWGLAAELGQYNIAVNALKPLGPVLTEGFQAQRPDADFSTWPTPEAMVKAAIFLAKQDAQGLSGAVVTDEEIVRGLGL